jgi:hypothetical protein
MSKAFGWRSGTRYCEAKNRDGTDCGNTVKTGESGYIIHRLCGVHRRAAERKARERKNS